MAIRRLCVFCSSSLGRRPEYRALAEELGRALVARGITLVYGGGDVGLMGVIADTMLGAGGTVIGVIPQGLLHREVGHRGLTELHVVGSMHERKALMAELADGFCALPGGIGTFEELFEVMTWAQLGIHHKPIVRLDTAGYWESFSALVDKAIEEGFLKAEQRALAPVVHSLDELFATLESWQPVQVRKWLDVNET